MDEVEQIKSRLDIAEVIGNYIELKKAGRNYKAFSPFHQEKNPSFMVSPEKNIWHDFSTDEGGDIFTFVMKMEGINFTEALEMLAQKAGVSLKPRSLSQKKDKSQKNRLFLANEMAMKYYQLTLSKNKTAFEYLTEKRGLSKNTIRDFCIGYAPQSWDALSNFMYKRGFSHQELKLAGLSKSKSGNNKIFDTFRGRITFPIFDTLGRCIGFSARILGNESDVAKYINTNQTLIYNKSTAIFGLSIAKDNIRSKDEVIIVEGNMDVIGLYNQGQKNAVAISGTSLTKEQLVTLSRTTKNIKICFDSDQAGLSATIRAIELAGGMDIKLMVINLGDTKDPDELIKKDKKLWQKLVKNAKYGLDFLLEFAKSQNDLQTAVGKKAYSNFLLPIVGLLSDEVERDHYIKLLSEKLNVSYESVKNKSQNTKLIKNFVQDSDKKEIGSFSKEKRSKNTIVEENILKLFLAFPYTRSAIEDINLDDVSKANKPIFKKISDNPQSSLEYLAKQLKEGQNYVKILALKGEEEFSNESEQDLRVEAYAQVHRLHQLNIENKKKILLEKISIAEGKGQKALAKELLGKYQSLISKE